MPRNILIDLNVILDVTLQRPSYQASAAVLELTSDPEYRLYISAHEWTTYAYLMLRAQVPPEKIKGRLSWLLRVCDVQPITGSLLEGSLQSEITDFEDAVIEQAALQAKCAYIVTRNLKDFAASSITAVTPEQLLIAL